MKNQIRSTLTTYVVGPSSWDKAPGVDVEIASVPVLSHDHLQLAQLPRAGVTMHIGSSIPQIIQRRQVEALAADSELYEVQAVVGVGRTYPKSSVQIGELALLRMLHLPKVAPQTSDYLLALIAEDVMRVAGPGAAGNIGELITLYPCLLDHLASHHKLAHVGFMVWEAALPFYSDPDPASDTTDPVLLKTARLATLYTRDPARVELVSQSSPWVRPHLPRTVGDFSQLLELEPPFKKYPKLRM